MKTCLETTKSAIAGFFVLLATSGPLPAQTNLYPDLRASKEFFKQYLQHPYPVRKAVFTATMGDQSVRLYEASVQSNTFYIRHPTTPRILEDGQRNTADGSIVGRSSSGEYWSMDNGAARGHGGSISRTTQDTPDTDAMTTGKLRAWESLNMFHMACWFGFGLIVPETVVWHGDSFEAQWFNSQYPHNTNSFAIQGEVLAWTNNLPLIIRQEYPTLPAYKWVDTHYQYDFSQPDGFYPISITCEIVFTAGGQLTGTGFHISQIEFGDAELPEGGYTLTNFLPAEVVKAPNVFITSTQGEYFVNIKQFLSTGPPPVVRVPWLSLERARIMMACVMILPVIFLIGWRIKTRKTKFT